eukprot:scaffold5824_cov73-Phaeocystis_antarctica.AAC.9
MADQRGRADRTADGQLALPRPSLLGRQPLCAGAFQACWHCRRSPAYHRRGSRSAGGRGAAGAGFPPRSAHWGMGCGQQRSRGGGGKPPSWRRVSLWHVNAGKARREEKLRKGLENGRDTRRAGRAEQEQSESKSESTNKSGAGAQ